MNRELILEGELARCQERISVLNYSIDELGEWAKTLLNEVTKLEELANIPVEKRWNRKQVLEEIKNLIEV